MIYSRVRDVAAILNYFIIYAYLLDFYNIQNHAEFLKYMLQIYKI